MILANWPRRASAEPHSSTAPNRLVEAYFLPWSVSLSSDAPYWRPPSRDAQYGLSVGIDGLPHQCPPPSWCSSALSATCCGRSKADPLRRHPTTGLDPLLFLTRRMLSPQ